MILSLSYSKSGNIGQRKMFWLIFLNDHWSKEGEKTSDL